MALSCTGKKHIGEHKMAEYSMTYADIKEFVDDCIKKSKNPDRLGGYQAEILAVLTMRMEEDCENSRVELNESLELWENQIEHPSEILLGTRYFSIKSSIIDFVEIFFTSGMADLFLENCVLNSGTLLKGITVGTLSGFAVALKNLLTSVSELDDYDFCVYMQVMINFSNNKRFTKQDLLQCFPEKANQKCNVYDKRWNCEHYENNGECSVIEKKCLDTALRSLEKKKILKCDYENGKEIYHFVL